MSLGVCVFWPHFWPIHWEIFFKVSGQDLVHLLPICSTFRLLRVCIHNNLDGKISPHQQ